MICQKRVWGRTGGNPKSDVTVQEDANRSSTASDSGINLAPGTPCYSSTPNGSPPTPPAPVQAGRPLTGGGGGGSSSGGGGVGPGLGSVASLYTPRRHPLELGQPPYTPNSTATGSNDSGTDSGTPLGERRKVIYSKKVFVGGLPPDIDSDRIVQSFRAFGILQVGWPHKIESNAPFPPKGFAFLQFQDELSVHRLVKACLVDGNGYYTLVSSPSVVNKPVQIRPWRLADAECLIDAQNLDSKKTVFVGGVPRPLTAKQLASIMGNLYGTVCYAGIDVDPDLGYPKGAGRVVFKSMNSTIAAISSRFVQIDLEDINKRVEVKPYILQDQPCDRCNGVNCDYQLAPYYCANVACLKYLCIPCWANIHSAPRMTFHKPLLQKSCSDHSDRSRSTSQPWQ